ncbi:pentatricopeptide repeat-containing protein At4g02750 [Cryptomeria japonica]|uniref:pentatricopeptide repeat-containing protein At4g02750 n=1 Tax=Cryptomeria japonica TaxID=3369 RepID=UPI0027D9E4AC|nr:pentatricopeptide repeat-containing protein At4g02750 [Cryptomeria japonica]
MDSCTYISLLRACIHSNALQRAKLIHAHINKTGLIPDTLLYNTLSNTYVKCENVMDARKVFDRMPERNVCSWTVMIAAYSRHGNYEEAFSLLHQMQETGVEINQFAVASILPAIAGMQCLKRGMEIHEHIIRSGYECNFVVTNALLNMYAKCGSLKMARNVFDKMSDPDVISWTSMIVGYAQQGFVDEAWGFFQEMPQRDVVAWNSMIAGFLHNGFLDEALKLFKQMPQRDSVSWNVMIAGIADKGFVIEAHKLFEEMPTRDAFSWNTMIAGFAQNGYVNEAFNLFQEMPQKDVYSWTAMITGFAQNGLVDKALKLFKEMPGRNSISWNAMIAGFTQNGHANKALKFFQQMLSEGVKPDSKIFPTVLSACANLAALEQGVEVHKRIIECRFQFDIVITNALIDMYAKCGNIQKARDLFDNTSGRSVVSWTVMIAGYAMHGYGKEALQLFEQMKHSGTSPNHITFVGVLSACSHAGLVDEGYEYFSSMKNNHHIRPTMEHYRCMVDLLGRAGCLHEAQDFINKMPVKADVTIWTSLLGACKIYNTIDLAESVAEHIIELDNKNPSPYVLLSNIYATAGRWDDTENIRNMMKDRGIKKTPSCSWIEVHKQVHGFLTRDR